MKKILNFILLLVVFLFNTRGIATGNPPRPQRGTVPPGEQLPIDSSLYVLMIVAIVYLIISYKRYKKSQFEN